MRFGFSTDGFSRVAALLRGTSGRFQKELDSELVKAGEQEVAFIKTAFRRGGTTDTRTAVRTGRLLNAYGYRREVRQGEGVLDVGGIVPTDAGRVPLHLRVMEGYDAALNRVSQFVIKAKNRFLAIPLDAAKTKAGVSRGGPRMYPDGFFLIKPGANRGIFAEKRGSTIVPLFALVRSVVVKPRPSLDTVRVRLERSMPERARRAFLKASEVGA